MHTAPIDPRKVLVMAASTRTGSVSQAEADVLVIVSPEYDGTFTPLLKNTVDWVTRIDAPSFAHLRALVASASPGRGGGANGVAMVRTWLSTMGIGTAERTLSVGEASVGPDGELVGFNPVELSRSVSQVTTERSAA